MMTAAALFAAATVPAVARDAAQPSAAGAWEIGPIIRGKNHSVGMPLHPRPARGGWSFDFPYPNARAGHVHYLTFDHGPLAGKKKIVMRYRIDAAPGVRFVPREMPERPATLSLYFQRRGDTWSGRGRYAGYRWYAPSDTLLELRPGVHTVTVDLDERWTSVMGASGADDPAGLRGALERTGRVGFVLGSAAARGHGVYATGPARLTVLDFEVR